MRTSPVIPAYNEEEGLPLVAREYLDVVDEVIVVDDGSSDGTFQAAQALVGGKVKLLRHEVNQGKVAALRTGVLQASGDVIIFTDADNTYPARYVPPLVQEIEKGADLVLGARIQARENIPAFNRLGNNIFSFLATYISCIRIKDSQTGMRAFRREMFDKLDVKAKGLEFETKMTVGYSTDAARCLNQNTIPPAKPIALRANNGQYLCAELGGGGIVSATRNWIGGWETFGLVNLGSGNAAIRASNGQYVCAEGGGGNRVVADRSARSYWETFGLEDLGNGNVALKASDGHYVCAELGGGDDVVANRPSRGAWETFKLIDLTPQPVALRASNGQYVVAEFGGGDGVFANRPVPSIWETFGLINLGSNNVALRANNGQYFVAEFGGGDGVFAYRDWIGAWETFELKDQGSGNVALRANNGQYVCAENGGGYGVVANRDDIGAWETFARVNTPRINTDPIEIWPGENNTVKDEWASTRNNNGSGCASC